MDRLDKIMFMMIGSLLVAIGLLTYQTHLLNQNDKLLAEAIMILNKELNDYEGK